MDGSLLIFLHGWPELSIVWRAQIEHFANLGWRCVAPDMRGYGGSSVPTRTAAYAVRELVTDMIELHDALGGTPAYWIGHDWGSAVAWTMGSHHPDRCRGVVNLCIPYLSRGLTLSSLVPLVDRRLYPVDEYPVGQWDYWLFYREHFSNASYDFEADVAATLSFLYRPASRDAVGKPSLSSQIRRHGGWFGGSRRAPSMSPGPWLLQPSDFAQFSASFRRTGFAGANAWYLNDAANREFAAEALNFGRITLPALFIHAERDTVCDTVHSRLADPMREDCTALTEVIIDNGHELMLENPNQVNAAIQHWLPADRGRLPNFFCYAEPE